MLYFRTKFWKNITVELSGVQEIAWTNFLVSVSCCILGLFYQEMFHSFLIYSFISKFSRSWVTMMFANYIYSFISKFSRPWVTMMFANKLLIHLFYIVHLLIVSLIWLRLKPWMHYLKHNFLHLLIQGVLWVNVVNACDIWSIFLLSHHVCIVVHVRRFMIFHRRVQ